MIALTIIALAVALASVAMSAVLVFRVSALYGDMEKLAKWQGEVDEKVSGIEPGVVQTNIEGVVYDEKTSTVTVKGNIKAEGWISSGERG